jgi:hypothetical protein
MEKPWDLRTVDERESDVLYTFIIFCEDEVSEKIYFEWFETSIIKINVINNQKSMMSNIIRAIDHCKNNNYLVKNGLTYSIDSEGIEIWCVYDRDIEKEENQINQKNIEFDLSISNAEQNCINVAWSNDAFELWILLHFDEINPEEPLTKERVYYYNKLTEVFKNIENPNEELKRILQHPLFFNYKESLKSKNNFRYIVRPNILPKTKIAIERAKKLELYHYEKINHYDKTPCTMVYKLIERLIEKGGKEIPNE